MEIDLEDAALDTTVYLAARWTYIDFQSELRLRKSASSTSYLCLMGFFILFKSWIYGAFFICLVFW